MDKHIKKERCFTRPFGSNSSSPDNKQSPLESKLFLKLGTRVATVVAHYEHLLSPGVVNSAVNRRLGSLPCPPTNEGTLKSKAKSESVGEAVILEEPIYENID